MADADSTLATVHPRLRIAALHTEAGTELTVDLEACLGTHLPGAPDGSVKQWLRRHVGEYSQG